MSRTKIALAAAAVVLVFSTLASVSSAWIFDYYPYTDWAPIQGDLYVYDASGSHYAWNDQNFGSRTGVYFRDADPSGNVNGYDAENWFYNYCDSYGGCAWATSAYQWSSNLPGRLDFDNNYGNPSGEVGLEIDAFDGNLIQANTWYFTDFFLNVNPASSWSRVKVRGARTDTQISCGSWWCAFEHDGQIIQPYGNYVAPGPDWFWTNY